MSLSNTKDKAIGAPQDFGHCLDFKNDNDRDHEIRDYKFQDLLGEGMSLGEVVDDAAFGNDDNTLSFPPKFSDYEPSNMSAESNITINTARPDLYLQFRNEFKVIRSMTVKLPGGWPGEYCHIASRARNPRLPDIT